MFDKVLIANRGEIACRVIRTLKEMNIKSVAVYSTADEAAEHVILADEAVHIGGALVSESYLDTNKILAAAKSTGAQAIHPGYGFLSENAKFSEECAENGITFIGPTPKQMIDFGLKHKARELAEKFNVPLVPGTGLLSDVAEAIKEADVIGYPVMLKSTAGGGGIGMAICRNEQDLKDNFDKITRLSKNNFKDSGLFLEKYIENSRHIEVQMFGNGRGDVAILGERDCSTQRRNQKVVEETPAPNISEETRKLLHDAARRLGEGVKYQSAGTVEFIYDCKDNKFYFLEVNTRLQVEHGITEMVFGVDLVKFMIEQAAGVDAFSKDDKFISKGAAMEFRVYAEDPAKNFRPSSGLITEAKFPADVRCDTWIKNGTQVSAFYDPLLAKVIVYGENREDVLAKSVEALENSNIAGFETNLILLRNILTMDKFISGDVSTGLLKDFVYHANTFEILTPGVQTTIQDVPGRLGYWDVGVPPSGPMDDYSFRLANKIVGNSDDAPAIEMTLNGPAIRFNSSTVIAITGGAFAPTLNGKAIKMSTPIEVASGDTLKFTTSKCGQRAYLAIRGGIEVPKYLGSASSFTLGGFGGHGGRALTSGDIIHIGKYEAHEVIFPDQSVLPEIVNEWEVAVLYGPHGAPDYLLDEDIQTLFNATWEVHYNSSRTGVRLVGPQMKWARSDGGEAGLHPSNLHDNAYMVGSLDFTGDMPVILGPDGPSLGGFVCPLNIANGDLWKIGELKSGDKIKFIPISLDNANKLREYRKHLLENPDAKHKPFKYEKIEITTPIVVTYNDDSEMDKIVIRQSGDSALLMEFGPTILDLRLRFQVHAWMLKLQDLNLNGMIDMTPGIRSLQLHFNPDVLSQAKLLRVVENLVEVLKDSESAIKKVKNRIVYLPLSWDDPGIQKAIEKYVTTVRPNAPWCRPNNIEFIQRINGLKSIEDVYNTAFNADYLVMGLGDVYLGAPVATPLDPRHRLVTTKYNPARTWTPENAVGIGGAYMCVYGMEGPGGYQLMGRTIQMWNRFNITDSFKEDKPYLLRFFDQVRFYLVSADELLQMRKDFISGKINVRIEENEFDIDEYSKFLEENKTEIDEFQSMRQQAFEDEKNRWIAAGELTFESHAVEDSDENDIIVLAEGEEGIYAPVAGNMWKLNITKVGTKVKVDDTLAIMESMKTEIPVVAECEGIITRINCAAGSEVKNGQCLFVIEPTP